MSSTTAPTPNQPGRWIISKFGPPDVLKWQNFESLPVPANNEVLIRILVTGIGGVDNIQRAGGYAFDPRCSQPGFTPGYDFVGKIESVGALVDPRRFAVGNLVASMCTIGAYATHIVLPVEELIRLRDTDDPVKMAALPLNFMTAYGMLNQAVGQIPHGSSILIGSVSGGVGSAVAQLVSAFKMGLVMFGTCSASKFDFVKSLGVIPIDRHEPNLAAQIRKLNGGKGVDVAFDAVGSKRSMEESFAATKEDSGQLVVIGVMANIAADGSKMIDTGFDTFSFITDGVLPRTQFFAVTRDYYVINKDLWFEDLEKVVDKVRQGVLNPYIGRLFRLDDAVKVNQELVSGSGVLGKMEFIVDAALAKEHGL